MERLTLDITDRAKERIIEIGREVTIFEGTLGVGWGARKAVLVKSGTPEDTSSYQALTEGDIKVWAPNWIGYDDNKVSIDLEGFLWMVNLVVTSAVAGVVASEGGCEGCSGCH